MSAVGCRQSEDDECTDVAIAASRISDIRLPTSDDRGHEGLGRFKRNCYELFIFAEDCVIVTTRGVEDEHGTLVSRS